MCLQMYYKNYNSIRKNIIIKYYFKIFIQTFMANKKKTKKYFYYFFNDGALADFLQKLFLNKFIIAVYITLAINYSEQKINNVLYKSVYNILSNYKYILIVFIKKGLLFIYALILFLFLQLILYYTYLLVVQAGCIMILF